MKLTIGEPVLTATLADNSSVKALEEKLKDGPIAIQKHQYSNINTRYILRQKRLHYQT